MTATPLLEGKHITLAVTGGIAAYKVCELARLLVRAGADVRVAMTEAAREFVGPLTFSALTGHETALEPFSGEMPHLALTRSCDLLVVAPATADILAKTAHGIADDLVSSIILGRDCPMLAAPAMNDRMWANPATQRNVETLKEDGVLIAGPAVGELACGVSGAGRMIEPADLFEHIARALTAPVLSGRRVVVTAGPTYEAIDPVRGITNRSTGKQGYAVARALWRAGAEVTLISGPTALTAPAGVRMVAVNGAREMLAAVKKAVPEADAFVSVAAVADWRPETVSEHKIKKTEGVVPTLSFAENPDILREVARDNPNLYTVGFALESERLEENAREKLLRKGCKLIVANAAQQAIGGSDNEVMLVTRDCVERFERMSKDAVAELLAGRLARALTTP